MTTPSNGEAGRELRPLSGAEWRQPREAGEVIELPSGAVARVRPVHLMDMVIAGRVPDVLTPAVIAMIYEGDDAPDPLSDPEQVLKFAKESLQVYNAVCRAAFVSPRIVDDPQADDEIGIDDVEPVDRAWVYKLATMGAAALKSFRHGETQRVADVPDQQDDPPAPGDTAGD